MITQISKKLNVKKEEIEKLDNLIIKALYDFIEDKEIKEIKFSKKETEEILEKANYLNKIKNKEAIQEYFVKFFKDETTIGKNGEIIGVSLKDVFKDIPLVEDIFKETPKEYLDNKELNQLTEITPFYFKKWLKSNNMTYKDFASLTGTAESTIKGWIRKEEIPEWIKRFILLLNKIDNLEKEKNYLQNELTEIKFTLKSFKHLLSSIDNSNERDNYE